MKSSMFFFIFFIVPSCLFAQYAIGLKASPFIYGSWTYATGDIGDNTYVSSFCWAPINAGVFFNYAFKENFAIQTEIKPMVEGFVCTILDSDIEGGWFNSTYIEMPVLFQVISHKIIGFRIFAEAGIALKFLMETKHFYYEKSNYDDGISYEQKYNALNYFNRVVLKGNIGAGVKCDINKHWALIADSRIGYDITPIGKKSVVEIMHKEWLFDNVRLLHLTIISFGISYNF